MDSSDSSGGSGGGHTPSLRIHKLHLIHLVGGTAGFSRSRGRLMSAGWPGLFQSKCVAGHLRVKNGG